MRYPIRALTLAEILDQTVTLVRNHARLLFGISACLMVPFQVIDHLLVHVPVSQTRNGHLCTAFTILVLFLISPITDATIISAVADECLNTPTSIRQAYGKAFRRFPAIVWTTFLAYTFIVLGLLCLVAPGVILAFRYALITPVVLLEGRTGMDALRQSSKLMRSKGHVGTVVFVLTSVFVCSSLIVASAHLLPHALGAVAVALCRSGLDLVSTVFVGVFYFSCRCRVENYDLDVLAAEAEREEVPVPVRS